MKKKKILFNFLKDNKRQLRGILILQQELEKMEDSAEWGIESADFIKFVIKIRYGQEICINKIKENVTETLIKSEKILNECKKAFEHWNPPYVTIKS